MHERDKRSKRHYGETPKEPPKPRKSMIMQTPVLVLNASYEPINICAARRAIVLVLKGLAMPEEENGHFLHAARLRFRHPATGKPMELRSLLPPELVTALRSAAGTDSTFVAPDPLEYFGFFADDDP